MAFKKKKLNLLWAIRMTPWVRALATKSENSFSTGDMKLCGDTIGWG